MTPEKEQEYRAEAERLAELPRETLKQIAVRATAKGETIHNEPFEVRPDMVADAILAADAIGRGWKKQMR